MPVQFDLPNSPTVDILGSLMKGVQARYAQPMAEENLNKIRALIQGQNLSNQTEQLKMPYVVPNQQSLLDKLKAEIAKTQTETQYIPTKYNQAGQRLGIQGGNLALNQQRYSPERLAQRDKYIQSLINSAPARSLSTMGKGILEQQRIEGGKDITGQPVNDNAPPIQQAQAQAQSQAQAQAQEQQKAPLSPENQKLVKQYQMKRIKDTSDASLRKAFPQINSMDNTLKSINFNKVAQFFGPKGQLKAAAEYAKSMQGIDPSDDYKEYRDFMTTGGPSLVAQQRQFLNDSISPGAQEHVRNIVIPNNWLSNPILAMNQFNALQKIYNIEKKARVEAMNEPSIYSGEETPTKEAPTKEAPSSVAKKAAYSSSPPSHDPKAFKTWLHSVPPEVSKAYIDKMK